MTCLAKYTEDLCFLRNLIMPDRPFEYWKELYENDPDEFERQRVEVINKQIEEKCGADTERAQRMKATLHNQTVRLNRIKNPISRLAALEAEFAEQVAKFMDALNALTGKPSSLTIKQDPVTTTNNVIQFKKKDDA